MTSTDLALTVAILSALTVAAGITLAVAHEARRGWRVWRVRRMVRQTGVRMARLNGVDAAIARLDERIAELNAELHALQMARTLLTEAPVAADKPRRGRPRKKATDPMMKLTGANVQHGEGSTTFGKLP